MLSLVASHYVHAGEVFASIARDTDPPDSDWFTRNTPIPADRFERLQANFQILVNHCAEVGMPVTARLIWDFFQRYKDHVPTAKDAALDVITIQRAFKSELSTQLFLHIQPQRAGYYTSFGESPAREGTEILPLLQALGQFPEAYFDATEAGNCYACERFTAAVYHLMRVCEYGLVAVATKVNVPIEQCRSWDKMIGGIRSYIKTLESQTPEGWVVERNRMGELAAWFNDIKNGWRNPVSHVPRTYREETARGMFTATTALFHKLADEGFSSVEMPKAITLPDEEP